MTSCVSCFWLRVFLLAHAACGIVSAAQDGPPSGGFRFADVEGRSLGLWEGDQKVFLYNHGLITNEAIAKAPARSCYFHPIYGLDGEVLTDDFPADHVYHRGLYWAWPHIKVGNAEYDLWSLRGIQQRFVRWIDRKAGKDLAGFSVENGWFVDGRKIMREELSIVVHRSERESRSIDLELSFTPVDQPITLWGAPGKSYGGLTFRFGKRSKTIVTVPSGRSREDLLMARLPWADFSGDLAAHRLGGAAVFIHPDHPGFPPQWMTREYGVLAVGYPGVTPKTFERDEKFTLRYRIWIHRNNPGAPEIQKAYEAYAASPKALKPAKQE